MRFFVITLSLAFALPVLAQKAPQIQWIWPHKKAGEQEKVFFRSEYTLPEGAKSADLTVSADDWYRHLKALLESSELRSTLSQNGRRLVETRLCIEAQGPRVARFVEEAVRNW